MTLDDLAHAPPFAASGCLRRGGNLAGCLALVQEVGMYTVWVQGLGRRSGCLLLRRVAVDTGGWQGSDCQHTQPCVEHKEL